MRQIVYVSSAVRLMSRDELLALLEQSRAKNAHLGITGLLLYRDGNFMQAIEGPVEAVNALHTTISGDPRHHGIITLLNTPVTERDFPDWSMGFRDLADPALAQLPGYSEFMNVPLTSPAYTENPTRARRLLSFFRRQTG